MHGLIDIEFWKPGLAIPGAFVYPPSPKGTTRILHAVGGHHRGDVKGTRAVRAVIAMLNEKGVSIDYREIQGIPFHELRWHILQTDIVVDQLRYGSFGSFAREALALGKPVVGHVVSFQREQLSGLPIVQAQTDTLAEALQRLAANPIQRQELGLLGRYYAESELCQ
jgi:glycosyltransferase involved in cell wall biosynthesis